MTLNRGVLPLVARMSRCGFTQRQGSGLGSGGEVTQYDKGLPPRLE